MGGGLMQLVAYGAQDVYLTGNPQITFFKVVYRRHTNFSMEAIEQTINGSQANDGSGTVTISRNGDLVHRVYVQTSHAGIDNGSNLVSQVDLEIGGQLIDRHKQEWMQVWNELSTPESKAIGLKAMQADIGSSATSTAGSVGLVQVPLLFWFCRNPGLALPLIALQYHEVKLKCSWGGEACPSRSVYCDYIYLDTDERRRFAQVSHEYLIEQVQEQSISSNARQKLNFNHPVKELIWTSPAANAYGTAKLTLNGHDRFSAQHEEYFQLRQPYDYHTAVPRQNLPTAAQLTTLDRQTELALPGSGTGTLVGDLTLSTDNTTTDGQIFIENDTLTFRTDDTTGSITTGEQYVIVVKVIGAATDFVDGAAITTAVGDQYFFNVLSTVTLAAGALSVSITPPTSQHSTAQVLSKMFDAGTTNGRVRLLKVSNSNSAQARTSQLVNKINCYSFALKPEEHQPSGTCNFSRIDTAHLEFGTAPTAGNIYAVNYNVLRIMSGMGGLAYSN